MIRIQFLETPVPMPVRFLFIFEFQNSKKTSTCFMKIIFSCWNSEIEISQISKVPSKIKWPFLKFWWQKYFGTNFYADSTSRTLASRKAPCYISCKVTTFTIWRGWLSCIHLFRKTSTSQIIEEYSKVKIFHFYIF